MDKDTLIKFGTDLVDVETSAGVVRLRRMNGKARDTFVNAAILADESKDVTELQALLVQLSLTNGEGMMFDTPEEANSLDGRLLKEIADAAQEINALTEEAPKG